MADARQLVTTGNASDAIPSRNPQFGVGMQKSYVSCAFQMHIPKVAKQHLPTFTTEMIISNGKGQKWTVKYNYSARKSLFTSGWKAFAIAHSLKSIDTCLFELVGKYELVCHIYRGVNQECSPHTKKRTKGQNSYNESVQRKEHVYGTSSKRDKKEEVVAEVPFAAARPRRVTKRKSSCTTSKQPEPVDRLLQSIGLDKYSDKFRAEQIDIPALKLMTDDDLKLLGLPMGPRLKILDAAKRCT